MKYRIRWRKLLSAKTARELTLLFLQADAVDWHKYFEKDPILRDFYVLLKELKERIVRKTG